MELDFLTAALRWELTFSYFYIMSQAFAGVTSSMDRAARQEVWLTLSNLPSSCFKNTRYVLVPTLTFWHLLTSQFSVQLLQNLLIWYHSSFLKIKTQYKTITFLAGAILRKQLLHLSAKSITQTYNLHLQKLPTQLHGFFSINRWDLAFTRTLPLFLNHPCMCRFLILSEVNKELVGL